MEHLFYSTADSSAYKYLFIIIIIYIFFFSCYILYYHVHFTVWLGELYRIKTALKTNILE